MADDLTWAPAWRIEELIRSREVSPVEVLEHFLARIEEYQGVLRAFDHFDERARYRTRKRPRPLYSLVRISVRSTGSQWRSRPTSI